MVCGLENIANIIKYRKEDVYVRQVCTIYIL